MYPVAASQPIHPPLTTETSSKKRRFSSHPDWLTALISEIETYQRAIWECPLVTQTSRGELSLAQMRGWLIQLYPFIETFPQWIALNITKTSDAFSRELLIDNVRVEKWHAQQWVHMAEGFGVSRQELHETPVLPKVEALTHYMWSVNLRGSIAESMSAMTYAIEGTTQGIARAALQGFPQYEKMGGINLTKRAYTWMRNHARYDEAHPLEALEIIKRHTTSELEQLCIRRAAVRSLQYFLMAFEECYNVYNPYRSFLQFNKAMTV